MNQQQVYEEIVQSLKQLPLDKALEVLDFVEFLNTQHKQPPELVQQQKYRNKKISTYEFGFCHFEPFVSLKGKLREESLEASHQDIFRFAQDDSNQSHN